MNEVADNVIEETELALSEAAAVRIKSLIAEEGNPALKLRVYISGGGCSGFQYGFGFEAEVGEDDHEILRHDVVLLVDPLSMPYLEGAEIDYAEDLEGERFIIRNPNATTTCGCGSSFSA
ncbi:MAG: iron-sulfur cluster insertion protein ErpA [Gammaproteobacteria bacterium]